MLDVRPPMIGRRSMILTRTPAAASKMAEASPPGPAPMMMTCLLMVVRNERRDSGCEGEMPGAFKHLPEFLQGHVLQLAAAFARQLQLAPAASEGLFLTAVQAEPEAENSRFPLGQILHQLT